MSPFIIHQVNTCRHYLSALLLLCLVPPAIAAGQAKAYYLDQLVLGLKGASDPVRADLAYAAVSELAGAYAREYELARREMLNQPGQKKLRRWAIAVERLASELEALSLTVTRDSKVQAGIDPGNNLYLIVDGKPVVISGPRVKDQDELEQRIVTRFCSLHPCDQLVPLPRQPDSEPVVRPVSVETYWSFREDAGPVCSSDDGLAFQFDNASDLRRKREACTRVIRELQRLVIEINARKALGMRVVWDSVKIVPLPLGTHHEIQLNPDGDVIVLYTPALAASPDLFRLLRPWLAARVRGIQFETTVSDAEHLLPAVGFMGQ